MFVAPGSLFQIVVANLVSLGFAFASAWYQPYEVCRCTFNHLWPSDTTTIASYGGGRNTTIITMRLEFSITFNHGALALP